MLPAAWLVMGDRGIASQVSSEPGPPTAARRLCQANNHPIRDENGTLKLPQLVSNLLMLSIHPRAHARALCLSVSYLSFSLSLSLYLSLSPSVCLSLFSPFPSLPHTHTPHLRIIMSYHCSLVVAACYITLPCSCHFSSVMLARLATICSASAPAKNRSLLDVSAIASAMTFATIGGCWFRDAPALYQLLMYL